MKPSSIILSTEEIRFIFKVSDTAMYSIKAKIRAKFNLPKHAPICEEHVAKFLMISLQCLQERLRELREWKEEVMKTLRDKARL
ncbi:hypothetical protein [Sphingobacterium hungaricum]